jgi:hypothetical protein
MLPEHLNRAFVATSGANDREFGFGFATEQFEMLVDLDMTTIEGTPTGDVDRNFGVSRITLRQILLSELDDIVHYGKAIAGYRYLPGGRVEAEFADGTTVVGDVLIGADGATSRAYAPSCSRTPNGWTPESPASQANTCSRQRTRNGSRRACKPLLSR